MSLGPSKTRSGTSPSLSCSTIVPPKVPSNQRDGTSNALVPGQPTELLACRYHGFNQAQPIGTLATWAELQRKIIGDALTFGTPGSGGAPITSR